MDLLAVVHVYEGFPEDIWVTDKAELAEEWRAELDKKYGIVRDEDGPPDPNEPTNVQILVLNIYRQDIG